MEKHIPWNLTNDERGRQQYKAAQQRKHGTTVPRIAGFDCYHDVARDHATGKPLSVPAVDLETFNYGRALGVPAAEEARKRYLFLEQHARIWANLATQFSALAWKQEMALRDVRTCETVAAQNEALAKAAETWGAVDGLASFEAKDGLETVKIFRYGRAFMSGQRVS